METKEKTSVIKLQKLKVKVIELVPKNRNDYYAVIGSDKGMIYVIAV